MAIAEARLECVPCPLCGATAARPERVVREFTLVKCRRCRFVYVNPQYTTSALEEVYAHQGDAEEMIEIYSQIVTDDVLREFHDDLALIERVLPGQGRLLDFGCGPGYFFEQAFRRGWEAHGSDIGEWTGLAAKRRGLKNLHVGELRAHGFGAESFDVIVAKQVFEHLKCPGEQLAEFRRLLRPGGILFLDVPNYRTLAVLLGRDDFYLNEPPQHVNYFTPGTLRALLASAGLRVELLTTSGGLKLENVVGRRTHMAVRQVFEPGSRGVAVAKEVDAQRGEFGGPRDSAYARGWQKGVKNIVTRWFVRPVLYRLCRVGVLLTCVARKP